jgi:hypothetical protein
VAVKKVDLDRRMLEFRLLVERGKSSRGLVAARHPKHSRPAARQARQGKKGKKSGGRGRRQ